MSLVFGRYRSRSGGRARGHSEPGSKPGQRVRQRVQKRTSLRPIFRHHHHRHQPRINVRDHALPTMLAAETHLPVEFTPSAAHETCTDSYGGFGLSVKSSPTHASLLKSSTRQVMMSNRSVRHGRLEPRTSSLGRLTACSRTGSPPYLSRGGASTFLAGHTHLTRRPRGSFALSHAQSGRCQPRLGAELRLEQLVCDAHAHPLWSQSLCRGAVAKG